MIQLKYDRVQSKLMAFPLIQKLLFIKNYLALQEQMKSTPSAVAQTINALFLQTVQMKLQLFRAVKKSQTSKQSLEYFQLNIQRLNENYGGVVMGNNIYNNEIKRLLVLGLSFFVFELMPKKQTSTSMAMSYAQGEGNIIGSNNNRNELKTSKNSSSLSSSQHRDPLLTTTSTFPLQQKALTKSLFSLPPISYLTTSQPSLIKQIKSSLYLFLTFIQLHTKKLILLKRKQNKQQVYYLLQLVNQLSQLYPQAMVFAKKIQQILVHLRIYYLGCCAVEIGYEEAIGEILAIIVQQYGNMKRVLGMAAETTIALFYNALKILLGVDEINPHITQLLSLIFTHHNMPIPNNYNQTIFRLFLIIKIIIFKQSQTFINIVSANNIDTKSMQAQGEQDNPLEIEGEDPILGETFSTFVNINLDTTVVQLNQVERNIVRHRVASLATIIGFKLGIENFSIDFLHLMHDSPFNNDIQTIKLCFQLFQAREFSKLQHLFKIVLSASTCKNLKQREVLIAMCSIFIGIYLENREQGLLYAKLNHFQNKKHVLREETLLQHLGFAYYNLAKSEVYLQSRQVYLVKALENFKKSYDINPTNYVVTYCMGKVYLQLYDSQKAYKYALQSCKCNRGRWVPFALLSCVYMVQRKIHKAMIIIDQLLKKYEDETALYYIRAYIEANKILLQVQHDEQVQAARQMGEQIYELTRERVLKSRSLVSLNAYCQQFYNRSRSQVKQIDENFFNITNNFTQDVHEQTFGSEGMLSVDRKTLLMIVNLFIEVEQLQTAEGLLRTIGEGQQSLDSRYYHALIHAKRKETTMALSHYKKVLQRDTMHVNSLIQCSLLQKSNPQALGYITLAGKFSNSNNFLFARGMMLCRLGRYQQAHECFIKDNQVAWLQELPQKLYYY